MASRPSWAVQVNATNGLIDVEDARIALGSLWTPGDTAINARTGFKPEGTVQSGFVFASTPTPNGIVHVAPFQLVLQSVRAADGGAYLLTLDAQSDINILSTPANATNPRDDLIVAQQSDTYYGDGNSNWVIRQVVGTPAGSPSDPTVTGSADYVPLARVRVDANATAIAQGKITDLRTSGHAKSLTGGKYTVAVGGILPVEDATALSNVVGKYDGMCVWQRDIDAVWAWNGTLWTPVGQRGTLNNSAAGVETTTSTSYTDLSFTVGAAVTVQTGTAALVLLSASFFNSAAAHCYTSFAVSGATTLAASDSNGFFRPVGAGIGAAERHNATIPVTGLTPGANTFTMKYKVGAGTGSWTDRRIHVIPT